MNLNKFKKEELIELIHKANDVIASLTEDIIEYEQNEMSNYCCNPKVQKTGINGEQCSKVLGGCDKCKQNHFNIRLKEMIEKNQVWS